MTVASSIADLFTTVSMLILPFSGEQTQQGHFYTEISGSRDVNKKFQEKDKFQFRISMRGGESTGRNSKTKLAQKSKNDTLGPRGSSLGASHEDHREGTLQISRGSTETPNNSYRPIETDEEETQFRKIRPSRKTRPSGHSTPYENSSPSHYEGSMGRNAGESHSSHVSGGRGNRGGASASEEIGSHLTPQQISEHKKRLFEQSLRKQVSLDGAINPLNPTQKDPLFKDLPPDIIEKLEGMAPEELDNLGENLNKMNPSDRARLFKNLRYETLPARGNKDEDKEN